MLKLATALFVAAQLLVGLTLTAVQADDRVASAPAEPGSRPDLRHYAGTWYELARLPDNGVQRQCLGDGSGTQLELSFMPRWLQWLPLAWGDYWVVAVDPDYRLAAVSDRSRDKLWLLSRTPQVEPERLQPLLNALEAEGYAVEGLIATPQAGAMPPRLVMAPT